MFCSQLQGFRHAVIPGWLMNTVWKRNVGPLSITFHDVHPHPFLHLKALIQCVNIALSKYCFCSSPGSRFPRAPLTLLNLGVVGWILVSSGQLLAQEWELWVSPRCCPAINLLPLLSVAVFQRSFDVHIGVVITAPILCLAPRAV